MKLDRVNIDKGVTEDSSPVSGSTLHTYTPTLQVPATRGGHLRESSGKKKESKQVMVMTCPEAASLVPSGLKAIAPHTSW
jgi:hypothetical protein